MQKNTQKNCIKIRKVSQIFSCKFPLQLLQSKSGPVRVRTSFPVSRNIREEKKKKQAADGSSCGAVEQIYSLARIRRHMAGGHSGSDK